MRNSSAWRNNRLADIFHPRSDRDKEPSVRCANVSCIRFARPTDPFCWPCQNKIPRLIRAKLSRAKQKQDYTMLADVVKLAIEHFEKAKK